MPREQEARAKASGVRSSRLPLEANLDHAASVGGAVKGSVLNRLAPPAAPVQAKPASNGLPPALQMGIEALSGVSVADVQVHRGSSEPAKLGALAFAQGRDIHLGPGQERTLPHEAWHVVQQRQGRVRADTQINGTPVNTSPQLEQEADTMGGAAERWSGGAAPDHPVDRDAPMASPTTQQTADVAQGMRTVKNAPITTLLELNAALATLTPAVAAMTLANFAVAGATGAMLDAAIAATDDSLYNYIDHATVIAAVSGALQAAVAAAANAPPTFVYETHGDKHFAGGPHGTKFSVTDNKNQTRNMVSGEVNPTLEQLITNEIARIRADAGANKVNYYFTLAPIHGCPPGHDLTIQLLYDPAKDALDYHGYPDDSVTAYSLSRNKGGAAI